VEAVTVADALGVDVDEAEGKAVAETLDGV